MNASYVDARTGGPDFGPRSLSSSQSLSLFAAEIALWGEMTDFWPGAARSPRASGLRAARSALEPWPVSPGLPHERPASEHDNPSDGDQRAEHRGLLKRSSPGHYVFAKRRPPAEPAAMTRRAHIGPYPLCRRRQHSPGAGRAPAGDVVLRRRGSMPLGTTARPGAS